MTGGAMVPKFQIGQRVLISISLTPVGTIIGRTRRDDLKSFIYTVKADGDSTYRHWLENALQSLE